MAGMDGLARMVLDDVSCFGNIDGCRAAHCKWARARRWARIWAGKILYKVQYYITTYYWAFSACRTAGMDGLAQMVLDDVSFFGNIDGCRAEPHPI